MKVGISYAVELDEIPEEVEKLLRDVEFAFPVSFDSLIGDIHSGEFASVFEKIKSIRKVILKVDARLEDCYTILAGYLEVQQRLAEQAQVTEATPDEHDPND